MPRFDHGERATRECEASAAAQQCREMDSGAASLKKLKREAAQKRKAQARSLKLHAEEQERLQRLEIDALVEQQRLQRLERQRCKENADKALEAAASKVKNTTTNEGSKSAKAKNPQPGDHSKHDQVAAADDKKKSSSTSTATTTTTTTTTAAGKEPAAAAAGARKDSKGTTKAAAAQNQQELKIQQKQKSQQQQEQLQQKQIQEQLQQQQQLLHLQQMRAVAETRRRLARGSRGGNLMVTPSLLPESPLNTLSSQSPSAAALEDHRVISTEYQAAGTQALMRVTLLAAGFVIGARGISARLIGQITGAIIQSWTDSSSCRSTSGVPIRLFRIQGKKSVVQAAVSLVEQAVAKYRKLCDCKRRGEFVQREHLISGVEFYYQPPPRKAFATMVHTPATSAAPTPAASAGVCSSMSTTPAVVSDVPLVTTLAFPTHHVWLHHLQQSQKQKQAQMQKQALEQKLRTNGSQKQESAHEKVAACSATCVQHITCLEQDTTSDAEAAATAEGSKQVTSSSSCSNSAWTGSEQNSASQMGSSLFSIFGNGGLPLPIAQDCQQHPSTAPPFFKTSAVSCTPFDFPKYDFFREILPTFPVAQQQQQQRDEYNPYSTHQPQFQHRHPQEAVQQAQELCMVCVERRSSARLMTCGHASVCLSCVQGLTSCPVCRDKIVGWQPLRNEIYDLWNLGSAAAAAAAAAAAGPPPASSSSQEACL